MRRGSCAPAGAEELEGPHCLPPSHVASCGAVSLLSESDSVRGTGRQPDFGSARHGGMFVFIGSLLLPSEQRAGFPGCPSHSCSGRSHPPSAFSLPAALWVPRAPWVRQPACPLIPRVRVAPGTAVPASKHELQTPFQPCPLFVPFPGQCFCCSRSFSGTPVTLPVSLSPALLRARSWPVISLRSWGALNLGFSTGAQGLLGGSGEAPADEVAGEPLAEQAGFWLRPGLQGRRPLAAGSKGSQ